jgi:hypothetical protein
MRNALHTFRISPMPSDSASTRNFTPYCALTEQTTAASTQAKIAAWAIHRRRMNRYMKSKGRLEYRLRSAIRYEISSRSRPSDALPPRRTELVDLTEWRQKSRCRAVGRRMHPQGSTSVSPIVPRYIRAGMQLLTDGVCIKLLTPGSLRVSLMLSAAAELMAGDAKLKPSRVNTVLGSKFCRWEPND